MKKSHALVIGATGATGRELVNKLLLDDDFSQVSIFVRTAPNINHEKLKIHVIDFNEIENYKNLVKGDILFSALGTTKKDAGGKDQQYEIDYTYQYEFAKIAADNGVVNYSLVSSVGANAKSSFFYPKIKGALEEAVKKLNFKKIDIFQPPMLIRQPDLMREGEKSGIKILKRLNKIGILKSQKPLAVEALAEKMLKIAKTPSKEKATTFLPKDLL
ncbi:MAG: NAD(P)H-binding protein [Flavobacteriales bacterium]|nr:NAD(P)H-binding protein [Flavobacteriales bacterium]